MARRGGPPLASIESLLSYEAKSTPRSEFGLPPGIELAEHQTCSELFHTGSDVGGLGGSQASVLPVESFQVLSGDQQTEEIFKLLSLLSPFAGEVRHFSFINPKFIRKKFRFFFKYYMCLVRFNCCRCPVSSRVSIARCAGSGRERDIGDLI